MKINQEDTRSAILCEHVANRVLPILLAIRDEPIEDDDSGWQFVCNSGVIESTDKAQIWAVCEVLELESSLINYLNQKPGTILIRENEHSQWKIQMKS